MNKLSKLFEQFKINVFEKFSENPAKMLIVTSALGWVLSSLAQTVAIAVNDNLKPKQKMFLIPQEIFDGVVNIASFLVLTMSIKGFASKLVSTGKILPANIREFLKKSNLEHRVGQVDFDISKIDNFNVIENDYKNFKKGSDVMGMLIGSVLSCNIVTPFIRNKIASSSQRFIFEKHETKKFANMKKFCEKSLGGPLNMSRFQAQSYSNGNLKI